MLYWARQFIRGYNGELRRGARQLVDRGAHIADVGAHRGYHALFFRGLTHGTGEIEMFEPNPYEHAHLSELANRYSDLHLHPIGLSSTTATGQLKVPIIGAEAITSLATLRPDFVPGAFPYHVIDVPLRPLDEIASDLSFPLDVIKCDVEGYELEVLRGAESTLRNQRPLLLIEIEKRHCGANLEKTLDLLERVEYAGFFYVAGQRHPISEFNPYQHQDVFVQADPMARLPPAYVCDFLFIARERLCSRRVNAHPG